MPKNTTKLWKYSTQRVKKTDRNYYAVSVNPIYYPEFLNKTLQLTKCGSSLIFTISGCKPMSTELRNV